jgi:triacylglycerol lipase
MRSKRILNVLICTIISFTIIGGCGGSSGNNNQGTGQIVPFDLETAIELAELSLVAYDQRVQCIDSGKAAITVPSPYKLEEVIYEGVDSTFNDTCKDDSSVIPLAFIATKGNSIYVVFRGTAETVEVQADLDVVQVPYDLVPHGGDVSDGFLSIYLGTQENPIEPEILTKLDELIGTGNYDTVFITGHSLGGALSVLAFPDLSQNVNISNVIMYSFAGPGVGNSTFANTYESGYGMSHISWRVVNTNDLYPMLPPLGLDCPGFTYEQVNGEEDITFGTALPPLPDFSQENCNATLIASQLAAYELNNQSGIDEDHSLCNYFMTLCMMGSDPTSCSDIADQFGCGGPGAP